MNLRKALTSFLFQVLKEPVYLINIYCELNCQKKKSLEENIAMGQKSRYLDCVFKSEKEYIGEKKRTQNRSVYEVFLITRRG